MDDLHITYNHGNGKMLIHLDYFFPCSQVRFNKLLKIIELDWQHETELKENLKVHFQKRIVDLTALWKENSKLYYDNKEEAASTKAIIDSRKHPNGLPLSKDELKEARADFRAYTAAYKQALSDAKSNKRFKERFEKYLESM